MDGQNIALIPGTTTPVAINTVNKDVNSALFNDNDRSDVGVPTPFDIEYDGFTSIFTAQALGLTPGQHRIKLAIADAGDFNLDSAVFIQANSFSDTPTEAIPEPISVLGTLAAGAFGANFMRKRKQKQAALDTVKVKA